jgi:hypothetical protein
MPDGRVFCFSEEGEILWQVQTGREMTFGSKVYSNEYRVANFQSHDLNGDGLLEIVLCSNQCDEFPTQLLLLNSGGKMLGEYWNSGRFADLVFEDLNQDGRKEIITGGVNNQFDGPFIAVLDMEDISGCSPNTGEYACAAMEQGSEKYYIRLPYTAASQTASAIETVGYIRKRSNELFSFLTYPAVLDYRFDSEFRLVDIRDSHNFELLFKKAKDQQLIGEIPYETYIEKLPDQVRYYNGQRWVAEPAMRNGW